MCWNSQSSVTLDNFDKTSFRWLTWNGSSGTPVVFYSLFNCHDPAPSHGRKANRKVHRKLLNNTSIGWKWAARYWRSNYRRSSAPLCNAINSLSLSRQTVFTWPQISPSNGKWRTAMRSRRVVNDPLFPERHETIASSVPCRVSFN